MTEAPPPATTYTVRESPRARRVTLRMTVERGLEVVVPRGFRHAKVPALVAEKAAWIARVEERMAAERARLAAEPPDSLPEIVGLRAVGELWSVEYRETASSRVTVRERGRPAGACDGDAAATGMLRVSGAVGDPEACRAALRRWVARKAAGHLESMLAAVARDEGLSFSAVAVRAQRTRWGSCSRRGVISLNRHLLFLPPAVVRYVLLHELCHTVRPDHSPRFWEEVRRREPEAERWRRELRAAGRCVPRWASG
ncbi:MAG: M48 family metallopeptidase [Thermoleophilia bacterium]